MPITYKDAGVDIDAGDELVERIKPLAKRVRTPLVLDDIGGFAGLCALPPGMTDPILVSGTDGVGTKLEIAFATGVHDTIGIDLVAMCINDIVTTGARPLFFLDYFATSRLQVDIAEAVIRGVVEGCAQSECALLGGETAEMPGLYPPGTYDLAGFAVGVVERSRILDGRSVQAGDAILGVASSGLHSNGYSLARKIVAAQFHDPSPGAGEGRGWGLTRHVEELGTSLGQALLTPTRIYARAVAHLQRALPDGALRALSHITGGGLGGNLPRVLPDGLGARLRFDSYVRPPIFSWLAAAGPVDEAEMRRTFNLGVGLCVVVAPEHAQAAIDALAQAGERAWRLGTVEPVDRAAPFEQRVMFD